MTLRFMETKEDVMFPVHTSGAKLLAPGAMEERSHGLGWNW